MNSILQSRRGRGFTLLELLLVVTGAMILIGVSLGIYRNVQSSNAALTQQTGAMQVTAAVRSVFPKGDYTGLTAASIVQTGTVPLSLIGAGNTLTSSWGTPVTLTPISVGTGANNNAFEIAIPNVPRDACNKLLPALADSFAGIRVAGAMESSGAADKGIAPDAPGPGPGPVTTIVKDENASPAVPYSAANAIAGCDHSKNLVTLTAS